MASSGGGGGNAQFTLGGFTKTNNPFEITSNHNPPNPTGGPFSFGVPTSFSGQSTTTSPFGNTPFSTGQTSNVFTMPTNNSFTRSPFGQSNSSSTTSPFGTAPFSTGQTLSTSPFGTAPPSFTQTNNSSTTRPFGTAPFSFQQISTPSPFGTSPFSTGQTSNSSTTQQFGTAPFSFQHTSNSLTTSPFSTALFSFQQTSKTTTPSLFSQNNNSSTTSPFVQTSSSSTTSPFRITPSPFTQTNNPSTTSPFSQTSSSLTTSPFTIATPSPFSQSNNTSTTSSPFGQTSSSLTTSPFTIGSPNPFSQTNNSSTTSPFGQTSSSLTTSPFTIGPPNPFSQTNNSSTTSPFGTAPLSFQQTNNSLTSSPFKTAPFSYQQTSNPLTTSPFGTSPFSTGQTGNSSTTKPFATAPFSFQQTSNSLITSPSGTTPFSFGVPPASPFGTTVSTPTIPASNVSVFPPFTNTVPWKLSVQGTRQKAYEKTALKEADGTLSKIVSISAMPSYEEKSPEELRLEDYISSGKTGTSLIPNTSSSTTTTVPNINVVSTPPFTYPSFVPSISTTSIPHNLQPVSQPVIMPYPKIDNPLPTSQTITTTVPNPEPGFFQYNTVPVTPFPYPKIDNPLPTSQTITTTVPNPGPGFFQKNTVPVTPFPGNVSQGDPIPESGILTENNQQQRPASPCPMPVMTDPFASEIRDTFPMKTVQHGISSLPVSENPKPAKKMPPVNVRQLSLGRHRRSIEKYKPKEDEKKVPFFEDLLPWIYKKGAVVIPRENPRSWVVLPYEVPRLETDLIELSVSDHPTNLCKIEDCVPKTNISKEIKHGDEDDAGKKNTGAIISNDQDDKDPNILAMIPKLRSQDYYMEPSSEDLAEIELRRPGFCCKVKDFVIGRRNYGSIKFLGETDVRNLDVQSIVQFANKEVVVYKDEKEKPPVGQGLNKAAEITLLNIKCIDKSTGNRCIDGPRVDKYKELLMRKATEQGSEFISYDPVKGEWRFKVEHF